MIILTLSLVASFSMHFSFSPVPFPIETENIAKLDPKKVWVHAVIWHTPVSPIASLHDFTFKHALEYVCVELILINPLVVEFQEYSTHARQDATVMWQDTEIMTCNVYHHVHTRLYVNTGSKRTLACSYMYVG